MADCILTYSKIIFNPLEPAHEDIVIEDIAHALSLMTRANGHIPHFYSVAQHSVNCCREAEQRGCSAKVRLGCLLHDASECYISDLTRPVKRNLPAYYQIEEKLQRAIFFRFGLDGLSQQELRQIEEIDDALLYHEFMALAGVAIWEEPPAVSMEHDFSQREFESVESDFIALFRSLTG
ncbi:MAG: HD domain-containing protein [Bacillota bacterium]